MDDYLNRTYNWFMHPEQSMGFSVEQLEFINSNNIIINTAYIGGILLLKDGKIIFSTFCPDAFIENEYGGMYINYDLLSLQVLRFIDTLIYLNKFNIRGFI